MDQGPLLNPRKYASQERSRATVDALVEATARILVSEGFDRASTNRIAHKAGVSIGSLYQYFPSKEALVAAVIERHKNEMMQVLHATLVKVAARSIEEAARELVKMMIEAHRVDPQLHRVLVEEIPRTGRLGRVESFDRESYALIRAYLEGRRAELRSVDLDLAAFICVTSVEALTHGAVVHSPERLTNDRVETFIDEVTRLVVRYLV
jgi:AcrR family transcriptional regulator